MSVDESTPLTPMQEFVNGLREQGLSDPEIAIELDKRAKTDVGKAERAAAEKSAKTRKPTARQKAAAAKAANQTKAEPSDLVEHEYNGKTYRVKPGLTPEQADEFCRKLVASFAPADEGTDATAPKPPKPARAASMQAKPKKDGNVRLYLGLAQFTKIEQDADWRKANASAWKAVKAGERKEQKASDGTVRKVYYSILITDADSKAVATLLKK